MINKKFVPVAIVFTDAGYPNHLPIFLKYECYSKNPWAHFRSAHMAIVNHDGTRIYASTGSQILETVVVGGGFSDSGPALSKGIERFEKEQRLLKAIAEGEQSANAELLKMRATIADELEFIMIPLTKDVRLMTAHFLQDRGPNAWPEYRKRIELPARGQTDPINPQLRRLSIFSLGEFACREKPFAKNAQPYLNVIYRGIPQEEAKSLLNQVKAKIAKSDEPNRELRVSDFPVPPSLQKRAAKTLEAVFNLDWGDDTTLIPNAKVWWSKNRHRFVPSPPVIVSADEFEKRLKHSMAKQQKLTQQTAK